jgi:hypothetical protein
VRPYLEKPITHTHRYTHRNSGVAQDVDPEFKPQFARKINLKT